VETEPVLGGYFAVGVLLEEISLVINDSGNLALIAEFHLEEVLLVHHKELNSGPSGHAVLKENVGLNHSQSQIFLELEFSQSTHLSGRIG